MRRLVTSVGSEAWWVCSKLSVPMPALVSYAEQHTCLHVWKVHVDKRSTVHPGGGWPFGKVLEQHFVSVLFSKIHIFLS